MPETDARPDVVATVRAHLDHIEGGDLIQATLDYAEDATLEADFKGAVHAGTFHGREAIGRWLDNWFSSFELGSYRFEVEESNSNGDRVFMTTLNTARGAASGVDVTLRIYHAFTVRDGLIARHAFSGDDRQAMLRMVGIESR
jgi:ketosteroid isomerase-like protein